MASIRSHAGSMTGLVLISCLCGCGASGSDIGSVAVVATMPTPTPTPAATPTPTASSTSTASVLCPYAQTTANITLTTGVTATSTSSWTCSTSMRTLIANAVQNVSFSATLAPTLASSNNASRSLGYALNGVKFDPGTGGSCPSTATKSSDCTAIGAGTYSLEALQSFFDFGVDSNNAHVQPGGVYHYHGMPEGVLTAAGVLVSWSTILLNHMRLKLALRKQNIPETRLPWHNAWTRESFPLSCLPCPSSILTQRLPCQCTVLLLASSCA